MASQYYGIDRGEQMTDITAAAATTGKAIELVVDLTKALTRKEVLDALEMLEGYLTSECTTPFAQ